MTALAMLLRNVFLMPESKLESDRLCDHGAFSTSRRRFGAMAAEP